MNKRFLILVVGILCGVLMGCEKRIPIDTEFPYDTDRLFCEVIGASDVGFFIKVTPIQEVGAAGVLPASYELTIKEDGQIIYQVNSYQYSSLFPYAIDPNNGYSLEIKYKDQIITSETARMPKRILLENLTATNKYVDSLGFDVVNYSFDGAPIDPDPEQYYSYIQQLDYTLFSNINWFDIEEGAVVKDGLNFNIQKKIINDESRPLLKIGLIALDKSLYQYLRNIKKLGIIPNDNIAGHQGNLTGAIGYFGIARYEWGLVGL